VHQEFSVVGKRLPQLDIAVKATGEAQYAGDIKLSRMLTGKVLRSPYPHARILKIDKSKAEKLPGVEAVISRDDVPGNPFNQNVLNMLRNPKAIQKYRDQYIFNDRVRYVGDAVAAVAAVDESTAERALELIEVEYEQLPAVFHPAAAQSPDAPQVHDLVDNNIAAHIPYAFAAGDTKLGLQEADYTIEGVFHTGRQKPCQLEPTICIASFDPAGRLTIWSPAQQIHPARRLISYIFNLPEGMVRWLNPHVGGSFGNRQSLVADPICVALAKKTRRPVKLEDTRKEDFTVRESRETCILSGKLGVKKDGTIIALQAKAISDAGAYFTHSGITGAISVRDFLGLYRCANKDGDTNVVYTNTLPTGGIRGYGAPSAIFALEQLVDIAAEKIEMDPIDFRLKNIKRTGDPSPIHIIPLDDTALDECIRTGAERIGWKTGRGRKKVGVKRRGMGMACVLKGSSTYPSSIEHSNAFIKLNADGSASVVVSPCEMGQGILGVLAQIAAEELGLNIEDIHVFSGDTDVTLFDAGSHASRSTYVMGNAVLGAAREVKRQLQERAAATFSISPEEIVIMNRQAYVKGAPEKAISIAEISQNAIYNFSGDYLNISGSCSFEGKQSYASQATFSEVEVDVETGKVRVLKVVIACDCGRAINPANVEGQLEGSIMQGIGYTLYEDFIIDMETGIPLTDGFVNYKVPSSSDVPKIEVVLVEQPSSSGPFGAKGMGEIGVIAVAPAIANAIYDAVGVRINELPITAEKIVKALARRKNGLS
jgi:xanthine dehydrogenase molybdenum-binding subunit